MKRTSEMSLVERLYLVEVLRGVGVSMSHLIVNFFRYIFSVIGLKKLVREKPWATVEYPNELREYPKRYRARHRLTLKENGEVKCTACFLCATACPAKCISIVAGESKDKSVEKYPSSYEIDTLKCVYCGFCVEACPVDAIRMDTGVQPEVYTENTKAFIENKDTLMERSKVMREYGEGELLKRHIERIRRA